MPVKRTEVGWRFGTQPYELYIQHARVMRAGEIVPLTDVEFKLLGAVVARAGSVVTKEELLNSVWGGAGIEENNIATHFGRLRSKLGPSIIETKHGVGYSLSCQCEELDTLDELRTKYLTKLFVKAEDDRQRMSDENWDRLYCGEIDIIRKALDWALSELGRRYLAIDLGGATARVFERLSLLSEGRSYINRIISLVDEDTPPESAARLFKYAGILWREADRPRALELFQRSVTLYRQIDDKNSLGASLGLVGGTYLYLGQFREAREALEQSQRILSTTDQTKWLWNALNDLGLLSSMTGRFQEAVDYFMSAKDIAKLLDDHLREGIVVLNLGEVEFAQGALDRAVERQLEAVAELVLAPTTYRVRPIVNLAAYEALRGRKRQARSYATDALIMCRDEGGYWLRLCAQVWALLAAIEGQHADAARLSGFVESQFARFGEARQPAEREIHSRITSILEGSLTRDSMLVWMTEGARWTDDEAAAFVMKRFVTTSQSGNKRPRASTRAALKEFG